MSTKGGIWSHSFNVLSANVPFDQMTGRAQILHWTKGQRPVVLMLALSLIKYLSILFYEVYLVRKARLDKLSPVLVLIKIKHKQLFSHFDSGLVKTILVQ